MHEGPSVREALQETVRDIDPEPFRSRLEAALADRSLVPGVLTVRTALAIDGTVNVEAAARRGAGVQLSYEGLALTRSIVRENPWDGGDPDAGDVDVLAAEVLVAKGFYHLAHTGVRDDAVEIVRRFGRNQTNERDPDVSPDDLESSLEFDAVTLAVNAGADLAAPTIPPAISDYGETLAAEIATDPLPEPEAALEGVAAEIERIATTADPMAADERDQAGTLDPS